MKLVHTLALALLAAALLVEQHSAARVAGAASQPAICNMSQDGLMACRPFITATPGPSNSSKPTDACCTALSHADLSCLCKYKSSGVLQYFGIDPDLAMQLPAKCAIPAPEKC